MSAPRPSERRPPPRELIESLPPFEPLDLAAIDVVDDAVALREAEAALLDRAELGFDTESKPIFVRGQVSDGPHLVQFAAAGKAWLLPLHVPGALDVVARVLAARSLTKVGFGLDSDRTLLSRRLGEAPHALLDLDARFRAIGYRGSLGLRSAIAVVLGQCFTKSKRVGTSNWSVQSLTEAQIRYAANDAYGAWRVYEAMRASPASWEAAGDRGAQPGGRAAEGGR